MAGPAPRVHWSSSCRFVAYCAGRAGGTVQAAVGSTIRPPPRPASKTSAGTCSACGEHLAHASRAALPSSSGLIPLRAWSSISCSSPRLVWESGGSCTPGPIDQVAGLARLGLLLDGPGPMPHRGWACPPAAGGSERPRTRDRRSRRRRTPVGQVPRGGTRGVRRTRIGSSRWSGGRRAPRGWRASRWSRGTLGQPPATSRKRRLVQSQHQVALVHRVRRGRDARHCAPLLSQRLEQVEHR